MATLQERLEQLIRLEGAALGVLRTLSDTMTKIASKLGGKTGGGGPQMPKAGPGALGQVMAVVGKMTAVVGIITAAIGTAIAAVLAVPLAIQHIVSASNAYVKALNPSLVENYEAKLRDLYATIGFGLTPVIKYATKSVKEWAGILLPAIQQIQPIVERLSAAISGAASGAMRLFARWLEKMAAQAAKLLPYYERMIEAFGAIFEVVGALVGALDALSEGLLLTLTGAEVLANTWRRIANMLTVAVVRLLGAFGGADSVRKFREGLERAIAERRNPPSGLLAAPTDSSVTGIEEIARKMAERAFVATAAPGGTAQSETDLLRDLVGVVKQIEAEGDPLSWEQLITRAIRRALNPLEGRAPNVVPTRDDVSAAGEVLTDGQFWNDLLNPLNPGIRLGTFGS